MSSLIAVFLTYFVIGSILSFCAAPPLSLLIVGIGTIFFYFQEFVILILAVYLVLIFINLVQAQVPHAIILGIATAISSLAYLINCIRSKLQKPQQSRKKATKQNQFSYLNPRFPCLCMVGSSIGAALAIGISQLSDFWQNSNGVLFIFALLSSIIFTILLSFAVPVCVSSSTRSLLRVRVKFFGEFFTGFVEPKTQQFLHLFIVDTAILVAASLGILVGWQL
jgi:hypothetical protein